VARLMRAHGLRAQPRKPFRPKTTRLDHAAHPSPNLLAKGLDPEEMVAVDCMSPGIVYCSEDDELDRVREIMMENQVRRLPVISKDKRLVGIIAIGDLAIKTDETKKVGETVQEISEVMAS
jgi:CBS domain-containing protein